MLAPPASLVLWWITVLSPAIIRPKGSVISLEQEILPQEIDLFDWYVNISSFVVVSDKPKFCELGFSNQPWNWIRPSWDFPLLRHSSFLFFLHTIHWDLTYCLLCKIIIFQFYDKEVCVDRTTSLSSVLETLSSSYLFPSVLVLAQGSLNSKYPPPHPLLLLFLNNSSRSIDATSFVPLLSGVLVTHTFRLILLSNLNSRLSGFFSFLSFLHQPKSIETSAFFWWYLWFSCLLSIDVILA